MFKEDANRFIKTVDELVRRIEVTHQGVQVSYTTGYEFCSLLTARMALLVDLLPGSPAASLWRRQCLSIKKIDIMSFFSDMKSIKSYFYELIDSSAEPSLTLEFNPTSEHDIQNNWILKVLSYFPTDPTPSNVWCWLQWIEIDEKYNFSSINYSESLFIDMISRESELRPVSSPCLKGMRYIAEEWLADYNPYIDFKPKHGSGATAEVPRSKGSHMKTMEFRYDTELDEFIREYMGYNDVSDILFRPKFEQDDGWRTSVAVSVPKTALKSRGISKEPTTLQWLQQGFARSLMRFIEHHPAIPVNFSDQELSRQLCNIASETGDYETIDLSAASDSITVSHAREILGGTELYTVLLNTRSRYTRLSFPDDGDITIRLEKLTPMGNALCFPTESLIFSLICEYCVRSVHGHHHRYQEWYRVYGDDIVVHRSVSEAVKCLLTDLGFSVNTDKSYGGRGCYRIREACGVISFNGYDVTPFRFSRSICFSSLIEQSINPTEYTRFTECINNAFQSSLFCLREFLMRLLKNSNEKLFFSIPRSTNSDTPSPYIKTLNLYSTNYTLTSRTSRCVRGKRFPLYALQHRFQTAIPSYDACRQINDEVDLWLWYFSRDRDVDTPNTDNSVGRYVTSGSAPPRWGWKWGYLLD